MYPDSRVTIETPEQITMELAPAGIGSRFLALALDTLIQAVLYVALVFLGIWLASKIQLDWLPDTWAIAIIVFIFFCIYWGYFTVFEIVWHGQTPGKRVIGIRVVKDSGRPVTVLESVGRNLMRAIDGQFWYLIAMVSVMLSRQNKRLGDYVAGTIVIHDKRTSEVKPDWSFERAPQTALQPQLAAITEQDLMMIETFLHRRLDLDPMVRFNTAVRISEIIQRKTGVARPPDQSDEDYLQAIAGQVRDHGRLRI